MHLYASCLKVKFNCQSFCVLSLCVCVCVSVCNLGYKPAKAATGGVKCHEALGSCTSCTSFNAYFSSFVFCTLFLLQVVVASKEQRKNRKQVERIKHRPMIYLPAPSQFVFNVIKYFAIEYVECYFNLAYSKSKLSCKFLSLFTDLHSEMF